MNDAKIIAMVPARIGSTRLKMKNLALINGKPLIFYAIKAAQDSGAFDQIVLNSDHGIFRDIADRYHVEFYQRPIELGSSTTKSDDVVMDFIQKHPCDIVVWVNPTSPLQTGEEIGKVVNYFLNENLDSLITVKDEQVHCIYKGRPVNYDPKEKFAQTQELIPVQPFIYSIMMWRSQTFMAQYSENGYAFFCGKTGFFPVSKFSTIIIKRQEDLMLAEHLFNALSSGDSYDIQYDELIERIEEQNE